MIIEALEKKLTTHAFRLKHWYDQQLVDLAPGVPPIYTSVDIRNAGYKISVVDTNLFPAGFNNLCETFSEKGSEEFQKYISSYHPQVKRILIYPEEHTRNLFYWKNIFALKQIIQNAGYEVRIGSASTLFTYPFIVPLSVSEIDEKSEESITVEKIVMKNHKIQTEDFIPDAVLINNDLTLGIPEYLRNLDQEVFPSPLLGWHQRKKSEHFYYYQKLMESVSRELEIDPWLLNPLNATEIGIDLTDDICLQKLRDSTERLLSLIRQKYLEYGINRQPTVYIKNNSGTYGLGITHVTSGKEVLEMGRRTRNKLSSAKGGQKISSYLLQEGIPTADFYQGAPLEPVVYLIGGESIGTFFRIHEAKNDMENLNSPGMSFGCLCLHKLGKGRKTNYELTYQNKESLFLVGSFLGKIASLASALEWKDVYLKTKTGS